MIYYYFIVLMAIIHRSKVLEDIKTLYFLSYESIRFYIIFFNNHQFPVSLNDSKIYNLHQVFLR